MRILATSIPGVAVIELDRFDDDRGSFAETYDAAKFRALGVNADFVMDAWSINRRRGTIRGLHFQAPPRAQAKLVRVARGGIFDIIVDLRRDSPTFGKYVALELDARAMRQVYIPAGFAHGFCTLEPDTEVVYKLSDHYSPPHESGVRWNDPALGITWPVGPEDAVVSDKDARLPLLKDLPPIFGEESP